MSTPGAPPPPPSLAKAVHKGDEGKVTKVLTKLTTGGGKKGRKQQKKGGKNKGGTPTDFNAPVAKWQHGEKAPLLADAALLGHLGVGAGDRSIPRTSRNAGNGICGCYDIVRQGLTRI